MKIRVLFGAVAHNLQENLSPEDRANLLSRIIEIETRLLENAVCVPLGFEINFTDPLQPHPGLVVPLLVEEQALAFRELIENFQSVVESLVEARRDNQISPPEFHARLQQSFNTLMTVIVRDLLVEPQRQQLGQIIQNLAEQRQGFIVQSFQIMAGVLELSEEELQVIVSLSNRVQEQRNALEGQFHLGLIELPQVVQSIRQSCVEFNLALDEILTDEQLQVVRIYRGLSFRPRRQGKC